MLNKSCDKQNIEISFDSIIRKCETISDLQKLVQEVVELHKNPVSETPVALRGLNMGLLGAKGGNRNSYGFQMSNIPMKIKQNSGGLILA